MRHRRTLAWPNKRSAKSRRQGGMWTPFLRAISLGHSSAGERSEWCAVGNVRKAREQIEQRIEQQQLEAAERMEQQRRLAERHKTKQETMEKARLEAVERMEKLREANEQAAAKAAA